MAGSRPSFRSNCPHQLTSSAPLSVSPLRDRTHPMNPPPVCLQLEACFAGTCDEPVLLAGGGSRPQSGFRLTEHAGRVSHSNFVNTPDMLSILTSILGWHLRCRLLDFGTIARRSAFL